MYFLELSENPWEGGIPHKKESLKTEGFSTSVDENDSSFTATLYTEILYKSLFRKRALLLMNKWTNEQKKEEKKEKTKQAGK